MLIYHLSNRIVHIYLHIYSMTNLLPFLRCAQVVERSFLGISAKVFFFLINLRLDTLTLCVFVSMLLLVMCASWKNLENSIGFNRV